MNRGSQTPEPVWVVGDVEKNVGTALLFRGTHVCMGQNQLYLETASLKVTLRVPLIPLQVVGGQRVGVISGGKEMSDASSEWLLDLSPARGPGKASKPGWSLSALSASPPPLPLTDLWCQSGLLYSEISVKWMNPNPKWPWAHAHAQIRPSAFHLPALATAMLATTTRRPGEPPQPFSLSSRPLLARGVRQLRQWLVHRLDSGWRSCKSSTGPQGQSLSGSDPPGLPEGFSLPSSFCGPLPISVLETVRAPPE